MKTYAELLRLPIRTKLDALDAPSEPRSQGTYFLEIGRYGTATWLIEA